MALWTKEEEQKLLKIFYTTEKEELEKIFNFNKDVLLRVAQILGRLIELLDFTLEEVEQAYLKKHKENYKRQREGY